MPFTAEELAEMARADAEIEESFRLTAEDLVLQRALDRAAALEQMPPEKRARAARQKAYYEAHREKVAAYQKAYREANPEKVAARQKAYYEANREKYAEAQRCIREARRKLGLTQKALAERLGVSNGLVSLWETGRRRANWPLLKTVLPGLEEEEK